jgi:fatty-acyl-CoA synthase
VLADLINQSRCQALLVDDRHYDRIADIEDKLQYLNPESIFLVNTGDKDSTLPSGVRDLDDALSEVREVLGERALARPEIEVPLDATLMIIYTSGTTGLPKGIKNSQGKLMNLGMVTGVALQLKDHDRGYICMPLFHSNAMFLGIMSAFNYNASTVVRDKFSARGFTEDVLKYGVTYWNYVGQPVHYVILALERQFGSREEIIKNVAQHPGNKLRVAYGNGASQVDQDKFIAYFGLADMMEGYGTTEMAIAVMRHIGDPRGSVGLILDSNVKIMNEHGEECPPAIYDENDRFLNYHEAVGEIVRVGGALPAFEGYHDNPSATSSKIRNGVYHSGDLGHIRVIKNKIYL